MSFPIPFLPVIPSRVQFPLTLKGTWDANTNTPTLQSSVGTQGDIYLVSVSGTTNLNGITDWQTGDWAVFNGSAWEKVDNTTNDALLKVNNLLDLNNFATARKNLTGDLEGNAVYISPYGDNTNGNGSILSPLKSDFAAIAYAKANGLGLSKQIVGIMLGGEINDSDGQIKIPPFFSLSGITHMTGIDNSQDIIIDVADWAANSSGQSYFEGFYVTGNIVLDFSSLAANPSAGFISIKNVSVGGTLTIKGNAGFIPYIYLYNSFINNINLDYVQLNSDSASWGYSPTRSITNCPPINYLDKADTIYASSTRAGYTATSDTVEGNFAGIDTKLASLPTFSSSAIEDTAVLRDSSGNFEANNILANLIGNADTATTAALATNVTADSIVTASIQNFAVTNAKLAQMPANRIKANLTGVTTDASDVTIAQLQAALNTASFSTNQVLFGGASGVIQGSTTLTFNPSGSPVLQLNSGSNPAIYIGPSTALNLGYATNAGAFFTNSVTGDICFRQGDLSKSIRWGVDGSGPAEFNISNGLISLSAGLSLQMSGGGTATPLTDYEETTLTVNISGALTVTSQTIKIVRENNSVWLELPSWTGTATASSVQSTSVALPPRFRPAADVYFSYGGTSGLGGEQILLGRIDTSGIVTWFGGAALNSQFTNLMTCAAKRKPVAPYRTV